jgi:hypothetical protein
MTRLFISRVLSNMPHLFLKNKSFRTKNTMLVVPDLSIYYFALHLKLSSSSLNTQLVDIFAYETIKAPSPSVDNVVNKFSSFSTPIIVYHFHNLFSQERIFLFSSSLGASVSNSPKSLNELFSSSV